MKWNKVFLMSWWYKTCFWQIHVVVWIANWIWNRKFSISVLMIHSMIIKGIGKSKEAQLLKSAVFKLPKPHDLFILVFFNLSRTFSYFISSGNMSIFSFVLCSKYGNDHSLPLQRSIENFCSVFQPFLSGYVCFHRLLS